MANCHATTLPPCYWGKPRQGRYLLPSATTRATLSRQWELLRQLPSRSPGATSAALAMRLRDAGFTISKRTIERDLNELSLIFPLERNDKSIPFGWHWSPAVQRLRQLELRETGGDGLAEFDLHGYLCSDVSCVDGHDRIRLQAWVSDGLARQVREAPLSADMRLTALERGHRLHASLNDSVQLRSWLLSQAEALIIEHPVLLREQIAQRLREAAAQYSEG